MCFQIRIARVQKIVKDVISQWEPLLVFLQDRRTSLGLIEPETQESFLHRVRTGNVWTQGLHEEHFISEVEEHCDLTFRIMQQVSILKNILQILVHLRNSVVKNEEKFTMVVLDIFKVIFPIDRKNQFALSDEAAIYRTLRSTRLSSVQQQSIQPWPMVRPSTDNTVNMAVFTNLHE